MKAEDRAVLKPESNDIQQPALQQQAPQQPAIQQPALRNMVMSNPARQQPVTCLGIDPAKLKQSQYTVSLLNEAVRAGLMSGQETRSILVQTMPILRELILKVTKGESSSVAVDTAENLLNAILYCIDACVLSCGSPEEAIGQLRAEPIKKLYESGFERVMQWFEEARELYGSIRKGRLHVGLEAYQLTITQAIPAFLRNYNIIFGAHHTMANIDYPLAFDDMSIQGILYIKNYLEHLRIETVFCRYFSEQDIERLLKAYGRVNRMDYRIELVNLFELVFNNAVFSVLQSSTALNLGISEFEFDSLCGRLRNLDREGVCAAVGDAVQKLIRILGIKDAELLDYLDRYEKVFIPRLLNAIENNSLEGIVIMEREDDAKADLFIFQDEQMRDREFQLLIKKISVQRDARKKAELIRKRVHSLHDFIDTMTSDCLYGDEFLILFDSIGNMELAVLVRMTFYEELRDGGKELPFVISVETERDIPWQMALVKYLRRMDGDRIRTIESLLIGMDYQEISFY